MPPTDAGRAPQSASRDTSRDGFGNKAESFVLTHLRPMWDVVQAIEPLERFVNARLIDRGATRVPTRPNPFSTKGDYTSWDTLTDGRFYGRHLPPKDVADLPPADRVAQLFRRSARGFRASGKSTALFGHFAQWFIDGVIRTDFSDYPRNILKTTSSHQIDLVNLYGHTPAQTDALREHQCGRLKCQRIGGEDFPPFLFARDGDRIRRAADGAPQADHADYPRPLLPPRRPLPDETLKTFFAFGGERANVTPGYAMMNILFLREHNRVAAVLKDGHPDWSDERLFQTTRNVLIAMLLRIVIEDYINHITPYHFQFRLHAGRRVADRWHRPNWVSLEFNLVYRWHSLLPDEVAFVKDAATVDSVPVGATLFRNDLLLKHGLGPAFAGAASQPAGEIGLFNTPDFLNADADLPSVTMGRTARLATYNDYRELCGFERVTSVNQISSSQDVRDGLMDLYGDVNRIELYTGLYAEDRRPNSVLGPLVGRLVGVDAFSQALTNPLIADTVYGPQTFSVEGMRILRETRTLNDVVARNVKGAGAVSFTRRDFVRE